MIGSIIHGISVFSEFEDGNWVDEMGSTYLDEVEMKACKWACIHYEMTCTRSAKLPLNTLFRLLTYSDSWHAICQSLSCSCFASGGGQE